jgi:hypothetical protein
MTEDTGPSTPNADRARSAEAAGQTTAGGGAKAGGAPAAGGVRRLTDAVAKGRRGKALRRAVGDPAEQPESRPFVQNLGIVAGAMVGGTLIAEVAGAANLGTALSFGQIAFAIAVVYVLVKR